MIIDASALVAVLLGEPEGDSLLRAMESASELSIAAPTMLALNFGDTMSYALAKATGRPLLFKGDAFGRPTWHRRCGRP